MKIVVKSIDLTNFKGFAKLHKDFDPIKETIMAENGQGKTTLKDGFFWALGFNHIGNVIPSKDNLEIPNLEIRVTIKMDVDGIEYSLERTQKEVWKTNKDTGIEEKMNNESSYLLDGIEYTLKNYKEKIGDLLGINYDKLLMLVEKEFFNSNTNKWGWADRRKELFELCDINSLLTALVDNEEYELIREDIKKGYSTADIKKSIAKESKGYKEEKERNMILIADKQNEISKYNSVDFETIESEKLELENKLTDLSLQSAKQKANSIIAEYQKQKTEKEIELQKLKLEDIQKTNMTEEQLDLISRELKKTTARANDLKENIKAEEQKREIYLGKIEELKKSEWQGSTICPTCKQNLPVEMIETAKHNFENEKNLTISKYNSSVESINAFIENSNNAINSMRTSYSTLKSQYDELIVKKQSFIANPLIEQLENDIKSINDEITKILTNIEEDTTNNSLIASIREQIKIKNEQLAYKSVAETIASRVAELKERNKDLTDKEMLCKTKIKQLDAYVSAQVKMVTELVNSKFDNGVSFSLFNVLYANSDHEISEECVCMLNGKTYDEMSYGEKFIADLEVVKSLQREYNANLPIFLDNAECVTRDYVAQQQLIELFASRNKFIDAIKIESIL